MGKLELSGDGTREKYAFNQNLDQQLTSIWMNTNHQCLNCCSYGQTSNQCSRVGVSFPEVDSQCSKTEVDKTTEGEENCKEM